MSNSKITLNSLQTGGSKLIKTDIFQPNGESLFELFIICKRTMLFNSNFYNFVIKDGKQMCNPISTGPSSKED